jgi:hypothetical protein
MWKEAVMAEFKVLSQNLSEILRETTKKESFYIDAYGARFEPATFEIQVRNVPNKSGKLDVYVMILYGRPVNVGEFGNHGSMSWQTLLVHFQLG